MELEEIDQSNKKPWPKAQESDKRLWNKDDEEHLSSFFYILQESDLNLVPPSRISRAATTPDRIPGPPAPCESAFNLMLQKCKQNNQFRKQKQNRSQGLKHRHRWNVTSHRSFSLLWIFLLLWLLSSHYLHFFDFFRSKNYLQTIFGVNTNTKTNKNTNIFF